MSSEKEKTTGWGTVPKKKKKGGKEKSGGPGEGGMSKKHLKKLSHKLSSVLRHRAEEFGLDIREDGYVVLDDLLKLDGMGKWTLADIEQVVHTNDKQRFALMEEGGILMIRANQGHTIKEKRLENGLAQKVVSEALLTPILSAEDYPEVVHGTYLRFWDSICKGGLNKMGRNHIHFAKGMPGKSGVISGMRKTCEVAIYLDLKGAMEDGIPFYLSANGVILTSGVNGVLDPKYFQSAILLQTGEDLLQSR